MKAINRPRIICHMMTTIDGKITGGDGSDILSNDYFDLYTQAEDQLPPHTGWMCGRVTMEMFTKQENAPTMAPSKNNLYMFGVDTKGSLRWNSNTIKLSNIAEPLRLVIVVTESTPKPYLAYLKEKEISSIVAGVDTIDFQKLFMVMKETFGVETLLLEGGGITNGSVMAQGFVDEISLLLTPTVINRSQAPSLFESKANSILNLRHFSLQNMRQLEKDVVWLRYEKKE